MSTKSVLNRPVLVLNKSWKPIHVAPATRAFRLLWNDAAVAVDPTTYQTYTWADWSKLRPADEDAVIKSVRETIKVPEVVVLTGYNNFKRVSIAFNRRNIFKRDDYTCQYCGKKVKSTVDLTIDHVLPRAAGGITSWTNCVLSCYRCNKTKGSKSLAQAGLKLIKQPVKPEWSPLYFNHRIRLSSWKKFISDMYWSTPLEEG